MTTAYLSIAVGLNLMWLISSVMWMGTEFILRPPQPHIVGGPTPYRDGLRGSAVCPPSTVRRGGGGMQSMARFEMEVSRSLLCESTIRELGTWGLRESRRTRPHVRVRVRGRGRAKVRATPTSTSPLTLVSSCGESWG